MPANELCCQTQFSIQFLGKYSEGIGMVRVFVFCLVAVCGLSQIAPAALISSVLHGARSDGKPGEIYGHYIPATGIGTSGGTFGTIDPAGGPPDDGQVYSNFISGEKEFTPGNRGFIATTVRRQGFNFFSTTQSYFDPGFAGTVIDPMVQNNAYWEFTVNGIFDYTIAGQAPQITGNIRTYRFEKVGGSVLSQDSVGTQNTTRTGQVVSGVYRLFYDHRNFSPNVSGPSGNVIGGTNLDIAFTFSSEDPSVVPEPTSIAIFSFLAIGGTLARRRSRR
jgi:hypothetical protein